MSERTNPYVAGAPVTDVAMFFGREDVFAWIEQNIAGRYADNTLVIHGQRRVGKTSVLKQLERRLSDRYAPIFFDLQGRTHATLDRFLWRLAREIVRTLRSRYDLDLSQPEQEPFTRDPEHFVGPFMDEVRRALGERSLLLVFDEFDSLEEATAREMLAKDLVPYFSRALQGTERLNFIFSIGSSGHKLEHMQAGYTEFFRQALYKKISFLEPEQARRLIVEPVRGVVAYESRAVKRIQAITSGHPYFTQLTCHELFAQCQRTDAWRVSTDDVENVLPEVIERGTVNLKFVWDDASDDERYTLAALALPDRPTGKARALTALQEHKVRISEEEVGAALLNLGARDVLDDDGAFTVDLVRLWLAQNKPIGRVIEELIEQHPIAVRFSQIAEEYHERDMPERALQSYQSALETAPDYLPAHLGIAEIHADAERWEEALAAYRAVLALDDEHVRARAGISAACLALGDAARDAGDIAGAVERYRQVLEVSEGHAEARERLAAIQLARAEAAARQENWDAALEALAQAAAYTPGAVEIDERERQVRQQAAAARVAQAAALRERKRFDEALDALEQAAAYEQGSQAVARELEATRAPAVRQLVERAAALRGRKRFGEAMAALERALAVDPSSTEAAREIEATRQAERAEGLARMLAAGERALRAERWEEAISTLERALALEPENAEAVERTRERIAEARRLKDLAETYAAARQAMADGSYGQAVSLLKQIVGEDVGYRDATQLLAEAVEAQRTQRRGRRRLLVWAGIGAAVVILALATWLAQPDSPLMLALRGTETPTSPAATATLVPAATEAPVPLATLTPTAVPLAWTRISNTQAFPRDTIWSLVADPEDPNVLYTGTNNAVYKTVNGGTTWQPAHTGLPSGTIWTLAMDPQDPRTLYTGVHAGGFFKTTDGAQSWQPIGEGIVLADDPLPVVAVDPRDGQHLVCSSGSGGDLYESMDAGASWAPIRSSPCPDSVWALAFHPTDEGTLFATNYSSPDEVCAGGFYVSRDGGGTWTRGGLELDEGNSTVIGKLAVGPAGNLLYATTWGGQAYRSADGGESWSLMEDVLCSALAIDPADGAAATCGMNGGMVQRTVDGGQTWDLVSSPDWGAQWAMLISPHDPDVLFTGGQGIHASVDGGETWEERGAGLGAARLELMLHPADGSTLYAENETASWLYRSTDGGQNWALLDDRYGFSLAFDAAGSAVYRGYGSEVYRSDDDGTTWEPLATLSGTVQCVVVHPLLPNTLYATGMHANQRQWYLHVSTDGGRTWETSEHQEPLFELFLDRQGEVLYSVAPSGVIRRSGDGGGTWASCAEIGVAPRPEPSAVALDPADPDRLMLATGGDGVLLTEDGCASWTQSNEGLGSLYVNTVAMDPRDPQRVYAGTQDAGAYVSFDGGRHWAAANEGLLGVGALRIYSIAVSAEGDVYAATPDRILKLEEPSP